MASINEIGQLIFDQLYPNASVQTSTKVEHIIATCRLEYAYQMWLKSKQEAREEGYYEVPSSLLREAELEVVNNRADISGLNIFRSLNEETWIQGLGGIDCECQYIMQTANIASMLCDDEYIGNSKPFLVIGKTIIFKKGTHAKKIPIIYVSDGSDLENDVDIDDAVGGLIRTSVLQIYTQRYPTDVTVNNNPDK